MRGWRRRRGPPALLLTGLLACSWLVRAQTTDSITIRGKPQWLRVYGHRGNPPVIVSSGDGGWIHLAPHLAATLASAGFFVVGLDVKAYLESFTSKTTALRPEDEPRDFAVLAAYASRGSPMKPILIGVSEGAGAERRRTRRGAGDGASHLARGPERRARPRPRRSRASGPPRVSSRPRSVGRENVPHAATSLPTPRSARGAPAQGQAAAPFPSARTW